ncbi:protein phosphatase 2C domain-containing protein [Kribbella sp. NPDC051620]|uniref:protein phosphatase 2C domain-containing protein n=1 Tax=Kribbella sp. NPDC051620 TaxID=3364120 RepID=UPI0037B4BB50
MTAGQDERVDSPPAPSDQPATTPPPESTEPPTQPDDDPETRAPDPRVPETRDSDARPEIRDPNPEARDPEARELPTSAPVIGKVRPLPQLHVGVGVVHRTPTVALDGLSVGSFHVAAASQAGTAHLIKGEPRQDSYDFVLTPTGRLVVAIVDGLGSRPASQVGARIFCEQVTILAGTTDCTAAEYLVQAAAQTSATAEDSYGLPSDDISFVGAVAVFTEDAVDIARVGDVSAFALTSDGSFSELFEHDDMALNIVPARLPSTHAPVAEEVRTGSDNQIVLTTDGLATDLRNSAGLREWLAQEWRLPLGPYAMANSLRYRRQGSHDDRTAVVIWRHADIAADSPADEPASAEGADASVVQKFMSEPD